MTLSLLRQTDTQSNHEHYNAFGELPMRHAPQVKLPNGRSYIPQHYRRYLQTAASLRQIVADISLPHATLLFADADSAGLYLQVGLIGRENYERGNVIRPHKLVYGRKWRIDIDTPTSEVIQTAFLAVKLARQHEIREMLTLRVGPGQGTSTPFSTHHDLPLMAANRDLLEVQVCPLPMCRESVLTLLEEVMFGQRSISIETVLLHRQRMIVDLKLGVPPLARLQEGDLAEYDGLALSVDLTQMTRAELLYQVMDALLRESDRQVAEQFQFQGFARFSRCIDPLDIARMSLATRPYTRDMANRPFAQEFRQQNYQVDASRAPSLGSGPLAERHRRQLDAYPNLAGHMPRGYALAATHAVCSAD